MNASGGMQWLLRIRRLLRQAFLQQFPRRIRRADRPITPGRLFHLLLHRQATVDQALATDHLVDI